MSPSDDDAEELGRIWFLAEVDLKLVEVTLDGREIARFERPVATVSGALPARAGVTPAAGSPRRTGGPEPR